MTWPFGDLKMFAYDLIMIDPAWTFETWSEKGADRSPQKHYKTMPLDEIKALPVGHLAKPDCVLFMWATWPRLRDAFEVLEAWGFHYASAGVWVKRTTNGCLGFGHGYWLRTASEPWLLGSVGRPKTSKSHRNVIEGLLREHSRKPNEAYQWCESYLRGARRADVFSRESRPGWEACGDEAGKFDGAAA